MKKVITGMVAVLLAVGMLTTVRGDLTWGFSSNLANWDASVQAGWHVQMFHDVNRDTVVSSIGSVDIAGYLGGPGANTADDVLLGSFTAALGEAKGEIAWAVSFAPGAWGDLMSEDVYSVIYNAPNIGDHTHAVVVDAATYTLGSSDPHTYSIGSVANDWVAIPEPTTFAFLGIGMLAFMIRKKIRG